MSGLNGAMQDPATLGVTHPLAAGNEDWPTAEQAAKALGITRRTFDKFYAAGRIVRYRSTKGVYHYDPADIDRLLAEKDDSESESAWLQANPTAALMMIAYRQMQLSSQRADQMVMWAFEQMRTDAKLLRERCTQLEAAQTGLISAREQALNEAHERQAASELIKLDAERKSKALDEIVNLGKQALGAREASKFLNSFTPEQIHLAASLGKEMWSPEQLATIERMAKAKPYSPPAEETPVTEAKTNAEKDDSKKGR